MIRNLSMKIGEFRLGFHWIVCDSLSLNSPIFMLKFLIIWSLLKGWICVKLCMCHLASLLLDPPMLPWLGTKGSNVAFILRCWRTAAPSKLLTMLPARQTDRQTLPYCHSNPIRFQLKSSTNTVCFIRDTFIRKGIWLFGTSRSKNIT